MPLPIYLARPDIPYITNHPSGSFDNRYTNIESLKEPITGQQLDGDILWLRDVMADISTAVNNLVVGILPGIDVPENKDHFLTTDGGGNLSWVKVQNFHIEDKTISAQEKIIDKSISTELLANQCVTAIKIRDRDIPLTKIFSGLSPTGSVPTVTQEGTVVFRRVAASSLDPGTASIGSVPTVTQTGVVSYARVAKVKSSNLDPEAASIGSVPTVTQTGVVSYAKVKSSSLDPETASIGSVPTVTQTGVVGFQAIPTKGKILQAKQFIHDQFDSVESDYPSFGSFGERFQLSITPVSSNSYIVLNISMNLMNKNYTYMFPATYVMALFRNNSLFNQFTGSSIYPGGVGGLFGGTSTVTGDLKQHSISLIDNTYVNKNTITYEVKGSSTTANSVITINSSYNNDGSGIFDGVIGVSTITAMEISN